MSASLSRGRLRTRALASAVGFSLIAAPFVLPLAPASANVAGDGLVINEVYGGGGNSGSYWKSDFIELYNPTAAPIVVDGWSVQWRSATGTSAMLVTNLVGSVPAGGHYLVKEANGAGGQVALPTADATGTIAMGGTSGMAVLATTTEPQNPPAGPIVPDGVTIVDVVGVGANTYEGAVASGMSNTASLTRTSGVDTDNNAADFTVATPPTPTNSAGDSTGPVTAVDPGDKPVLLGQPIAPFDLAATGGTAPYTWGATGLPAGITVGATGHVSGTPTELGTFTVTITVSDSGAPQKVDSEQFDFVVTEGVVITPIADIQGSGADSPKAGQTVTTEGVVTAMYRTGGLNGMYIQTADTGSGTDATPGRSDAVFVFGANSMPAEVAIGDSVQVAGVVSEFNGTTEITPGAGQVTELEFPLAPVMPLAAAYPTTEADREAHEGELLAPTGPFTVTNTFNTNRFGEVGLATGTIPLQQASDRYADDDLTNLEAVKADNAARGVTLDDGATIDFVPSQGSNIPPSPRPNMDIPLPYLTPGNPIRVGAAATLTQPVILNFAFNAWRFQPTTHLTAEGTPPATFTNTRLDNLVPQNVGGDLKIGTFNVLNYFNTTGQQFVANGSSLVPPASCTYFYDRTGDEVANNACNPNGPRGAAEVEDFQRQQAKIVRAINALDADIVALEEIENSIKLVKETWRDDAVASLVAALNADAGGPVWRFVASPVEASLPANVSLQDVIRNAFIYKPARVKPVGQSDIYFEESFNANPTTGAPAGAFANAREPLAQAFKPAGAPNSAAFAVITNHFKSKGDSTPAAMGDNANSEWVGAFNGDRTRQAEKLVGFANAFAASRGTDRIFLAGDFNSYSEEDPIHVLEAGGFELVESDQAGDESYSFSGLSGSLDHVLANGPAMATVTGADIWEINANESLAFQYSRHNYNATPFFDATNPFAASDHNPAIVGIDVPEFVPHTRDIQILATNDFHGRLQNNTGNTEAGAAVLAGAVKQLRAENPDTVFAAAGDLIGASTFESFIANDKPTIDALNEAGLEVSAIGNHEFDQGYDDLVNRVMAAYDATTNPEGGAEWQYIGANVKLRATGNPAVPATWIRNFGDVQVGFIGAVTEELPSLVNPDGIAEIEVTDIVEATNSEADALVAEGVDVVVLLVHEGAPGTDCTTMDDNPVSAFGSIIHGVNANVDAIVSGHTHLKYNCSFEESDWAGRPVTRRPVVSAGQYGMALNQLVFEVDTTTGDVLGLSQEVLDLKSGAGTFNYPADQATTAIVTQAVNDAVGPGNVVLGKIGGEFGRAKFATGTENRGGESTLGNEVAEVQRWATPATVGGAQIALMNPGGLRADMVGNAGEFPRDLTYRQAANVQPFANTLVNMDLTGAQLETVLEQQWQRTATGSVPSRAFLKLGLSSGFTYTYNQYDDPAIPGARLGEVTGMWLNGVPLDPAASYSVTVNSFLAAGGDNFRELANGASKQDTGMTDLQAMVEYMARFTDSPRAVDYSQRGVGVTLPAGSGTLPGPGDQVSFDLYSLSMTHATDLVDAEVQVSLDGAPLGTFPVTTTKPSSPDGSANSNDDAGTASISVVVPAGAYGEKEFVVTGLTTGTTVRVPVTLAPLVKADSTVSGTAATIQWGRGGSLQVSVSSTGTRTGTITVTEGTRVLGTVTLADGVGTLPIPARSLSVGTHTLSLAYSGDELTNASNGTATVTVTRGRR